MAQWTWLTSAVIAGMAAFILSATASAPLASALGAGLLASTLVAIIWYSWDTHRLVESQQRQAKAQQQRAEIENHPWLAASTLKWKLERNERAAPLGHHHLSIEIKNTGRTPAYVHRIGITGHDVRGAGECRLALEDQPKARQVIVPGESLGLVLGVMVFNVPRPQAPMEVRAAVAYSTAEGGRGDIGVGFRYEHEAWLNLPTSYTFTLSTGTRFPAEDPWPIEP
jgi:hypothetical protein